MRVLLVTPMPPRAEAPGAIPLVLDATLAGLRRRHEVTLVTVVGDEPGEAEAAAELDQAGVEIHVIDRRQPSGLERWRRRCRLAATWAATGRPWRTVWFADPKTQATLDLLTRSRTFDVAAVEDSSMGLFDFPPGVPTVITEHEVHRPRSTDWHCGPPRHWARWGFGEADSRRLSPFQRAVWRRFDRIQVFSDWDADAVGELAPELRERVRVNPFGVTLPVRSDPAREEPGEILFVGNFTHPPNVDAALWLGTEIMPAIRRRREGSRLTIIGAAAPAEVDALQAPDVRVLGEVPVVAPHVEAASVVLAPIRIGGGMRMKVLYALASGKAVVTTARGAAGLMLDGRDLPLEIAEDAESIAEAVTALLDDPLRRRTLGSRARAFAVEHHGPDVYGRRLAAVYEDAIEGGRSSGFTVQARP